MSKRVAFFGAVAAFVAVVAIGVWGFGGGGIDRMDPATQAFCALDTDFRDEAMADPAGFDQQMAAPGGQERLSEMLDRAPSAIADEVRTMVEAIREHGHAAFTDPTVAAAADRIEAWENRACKFHVTTTFPFPVGNVPGAPFECPPGFVAVDTLSPMYEGLLDAARATGEWVDSSELESYLTEEAIPQMEGFEGMGGVICLPADSSGEVDPDEITDHLEQYFPEGFDSGG